MQRMKQLARTAVYWPKIDSEIVEMCRHCTTCGEHQNKPEKQANHPWMLPEKPWSRIHIDHAINFLGSNWLVMTDAYSKYPCIYPTSSTSTRSTTDLLEEACAHFGYPHTIVSDNATTYKSEEFQHWCRERGICHLTGAPYHPETNGAAERLIQTFKQTLKKSTDPPKKAALQFLMQYRRTPLANGYSPSELLNGRQIRATIDALIPSPAHWAQRQQAREATKSQTSTSVCKVSQFPVGALCYALYCGPRSGRDPRWVPATVTKVFGPRSVNVRVSPRGPVWRRHLDQLRPRSQEDEDPGDDDGARDPDTVEMTTPTTIATGRPAVVSPRLPQRQETSPTLPEYGRHNLRRSRRTRKPRVPYDA